MGEEAVAPGTLPTAAEIASFLPRLGVAADDAREILARLPRWTSDHVWRSALLRARARLTAHLGDLGEFELASPAPAPVGDGGGMFELYVLLNAVPDVLSWHAGRAISREVSWDTLADLGRVLGEHRRIEGRFGFDQPDWMSRHFRGLLFQLGRLQFERRPSPEDPKPARRMRLAAGDAVLDVHIPQGGPLSPELCDDAFTRAAEFFARHFPETRYRVAICASWLLDPQLAAYLPPSSNIVRFQRRFDILPGWSDGNESVVRYVFWRNRIDVDQVRCTTSLQRAVIRHLQSGRRWHVRSGWLALAA